MLAPTVRPGRTEQFLANLVDTALPLILEAGVRGSSVDIELDLWKRLGKVAGQPEEDCLARFAGAAYEVALDHGARGDFLALELGLWHAFRSPVRRGAVAASSRAW